MLLRKEIPLKDYSTFAIGGPARYFVEATRVEDVVDALLYCKKKKLQYIVVGNGSNCLFDDRGFDGLVIHNKIRTMNHTGGTFTVGAGYSFPLLGHETTAAGWSGLEFAVGIPGTVGGAVYMNAAANDMQIADTILSIKYIAEDGEERIFAREDLVFDYRRSTFHDLRGVIVEISFTLHRDHKASARVQKLLKDRKKNQPYGERSAGCVFRNPPKKAAGALIDRCGLKDKVIGGAKISPQHANFIVNTGDATANDVLDLIAIAKTEVEKQSGIELETEIKHVPYN